jgi:hypothetical protein
MHISQTWMTFFLCTHVMIIRHVYIYEKDSQFEVKVIVCVREFLIDRIDFVQLRQFLEETFCDSKYDRCRSIWCLLIFLRWWYGSSQYTDDVVYCWMSTYDWSSYLMSRVYILSVGHITTLTHLVMIPNYTLRSLWKGDKLYSSDNLIAQ